MLVPLKHVWESIIYKVYRSSEFFMSIFPSALWFDGFFIDILLMFLFPGFPQWREDEWIRKDGVVWEFQEFLSCFTLWMLSKIRTNLPLNMNKAPLKNTMRIYSPHGRNNTNSTIRSTRYYIFIPHVISEKLQIFNNILLSFPISNTEPDYFLPMVAIVQ